MYLSTVGIRTLCTKTKFELMEEFLFSESLQTTAAATYVLNLFENFFEKHDISLEKIGYVCSDGASALAVNRDSWHSYKNMNPT